MCARAAVLTSLLLCTALCHTTTNIRLSPQTSLDVLQLKAAAMALGSRSSRDDVTPGEVNDVKESLLNDDSQVLREEEEAAKVTQPTVAFQACNESDHNTYLLWCVCVCWLAVSLLCLCQAAKSKSNALIISFVAMVIVGLGNKIFQPLQFIPM